MKQFKNLILACALAIPAFAAMMPGVTLIYGGGGGGGGGGGSSTIMYAPDQTTILKQWSVGGYSVFFSDSGTIFYTTGSGTSSGCANIQGYGQIVEMRWDGTVIRTLDMATKFGSGFFHHAFNITKNGTILAIASENYNSACGEQIVEYDIKTDKVVWRWHTNDHKAASDITKLPIKSGSDPYHVNGLDLNTTTNRVTFSSHYTFEVYVVDHSTDSTTAKGSAGDILFRWGNPSNYGISGATQYISTAVHSSRFVPKGYVGEGNLLLYANQSPVNTGTIKNFATGYEVRPIMNGSAYAKRINGEYDYEVMFAGVGSGTTTNTGGMDKLQNGNWLVTYTGRTQAAEFNAGTVNQVYSGAAKTWTAGSSNGIRRYPLCHSGLKKVAESDAAVAAIYNAAACDEFPTASNPGTTTSSSSSNVSSSGTVSGSSSSSGTTLILSQTVLPGISMQWNSGELRLAGLRERSQVRVMNLMGKVQQQMLTSSSIASMQTKGWKAGTYLVQVRNSQGTWSSSISISK